MKNTILLATLALGAGLSSANAATLLYAGAQLNVDAKQTTLPVVADSVGWRNAGTTKTFDVDGDNIIGTDGYTGRASNVAPNIIPSYLTYNQIVGGGNAFGYMDNPLDPTGIDTARVGFQGSTSLLVTDMFSVTVVGTTLSTQTLGLAIQFDTFGSGTQTYVLEHRTSVGGTVITSATSGLINNADNGYDWAFFNISNAASGDVFVLTSLRGTAGRTTFGQVAFDTVPEPSSALLGGLGLLALLRRRR